MHRRFVGITVIALSLVAGPVAASTFVAMTQEEMVRQADAVVQGRVLAMDTYWSESGRMVVTDIKVAVDEVVIGKAGAIVEVRTFGGQIGDVHIDAIGFPKFEADEKVLLFLAREGRDASLRVLGYQQGQFRVVTRLDGVTLAVPMVDEEARFLTKDGRAVPTPQSVRLDAFKQHLRATADAVAPTK